MEITVQGVPPGTNRRLFEEAGLIPKEYRFSSAADEAALDTLTNEEVMYLIFVANKLGKNFRDRNVNVPHGIMF
jgi:hypothetical protein